MDIINITNQTLTVTLTRDEINSILDAAIAQEMFYCKLAEKESRDKGTHFWEEILPYHKAIEDGVKLSKTFREEGIWKMNNLSEGHPRG